MIHAVGQTSVHIEPIATLDDLCVVTKKFAGIIDSSDFKSVVNLASATGELSRSVATGNDEQILGEVADALIATLVIAANFGFDSAEIGEALNARMSAQATREITASVKEMLMGRGMGIAV